MKNHPRALWQLRRVRWSVYGAVTLLALALISALALPSLIKRIAIEQTQEKIGRKLSIGDVKFNPFILALTVNDLTLYEADQTTIAFSAKEVLVNASITSALRLAAVLDEVKLVAPNVHLVRLSNEGIGRYNFSDILDRIEAMPKSDSPTLFSLANLQLVNGMISFDDKVTEKRIDIRALNLGVPLLSNLPGNIDTFVQPHLSATINGTPLQLKGRSKPFSSTEETVLAIDIDKLDLVNYLPFVPVTLPVKVQSALLSTKLDLSFSRADNRPHISLSGKASLADLAIAENNAAQLLKAGSINVNIKQLDVMQMQGVIEELSIDKPEIWANLNNKGQLNWARLSGNQTTPPTTKSASSSSAEKTTAPAISILKLALQEGRINWSDSANATPRQQVQLDDIKVEAENISTAADAKPATLKLSLKENDQGELTFDGEVAPLKGNINGTASIKALQLSNYQNYLNASLNGLISGLLSTQTHIQITDGRVKVDKLNVELNKLKLTSKTKSADDSSTGKGSKGNKAGKDSNNIIAAQSIALTNASLDLQGHKADAESLRINGLDSTLKRDAKGAFNLQELFVAGGKNSGTSNDTTSSTTSSPTALPTTANTAVAPKTNPAPVWQTRLTTLALSDSSLSYEDAGVGPTQKLRLEGINLKVDNLSSTLDQVIKLSLQSKFNQNGSLNINGQAAAKLKNLDLVLDVANLPLAPFQSYFTDYLNVTLRSGTLSSKGKLSLTPPLNQQAFALQYNGSADVNNFRAQDKLSNNDFLRWRNLGLQGIAAKIADKPVIVLDKIALSDFYARAILSEDGKLNLQDIIVSKDEPKSSLTAPPVSTDKASTTVDSTTTSIAPVTPAAPAPNAAIIRIGQTTLQGGNINFTDNFVKPNYSANMTGMSGTIGSIASDKPQPATIDLNGKIDNDAPLKISGTLNPLFKPMFLDIKASANGVQLPRLTPYSAKYAGYPITKGKLSMDVEYKIENDKLVAQNSVRIEQLTFGDHVDGPNVTKLPVMLAISLLKDRDGTINLNLPISGSLSDPQFSIGGIVMRVFVNLIVKAVTSPFSLISSMFGGSEAGELSYVEFEPGSSELTQTIRNKLDTLGYAMHQRPALKIDVMGRVDPAVDDAGLRHEIINNKMRDLKRKEIIEKEGQPSGSIDLNKNEHDRYLEKLYKGEKFKKPRNMIGFAKTLPPEEMKQLMVDNTPITEDDLRNLAQRRADLIRNYLQDQSIISADRIFLIAPKLNAEGIKDKGPTSRVELTLQQ